MDSPVDRSDSPLDGTETPASFLPPPPDEFRSAEPGTGAVEPAVWSPRARRWLQLAVGVGSLLLLYGLFLAVRPSRSRIVFELASPILSVVLAGAGGLIATQAFRLLTRFTPETVYRPGNPNWARGLFVIVGLLGAVISSGLASDAERGAKLALMSVTSIALVVAGAGALWVWRWLSTKVETAWPAAEASRAAHQPPRAWSVFLAFGWGLFSTLLSIGLEFLLLLLAVTYFSRMLPRRVFDITSIGFLRDPTLIVALIAGIVVVAPLIEELSKALGLRFLRGAIRTHADGLLMGLAAGLGFGFIESAIYIFGGVGGGVILVLIWVRVATIFMHSLTTGLVGLEYAHARLSGGGATVRHGLVRAFVLHGAWNGSAVLILLSGVLGSLCGILVILGFAVGLGVRVLPRVLTAAVERATQDDHALAGVPLPNDWSPLDEGMWWRLAGGQPMWPPPPPVGDFPRPIVP